MTVSRREAQAIVTEELREFSPTLSDKCDFKSGPNLPARELAWWNKYEDDESPTTDRNKAFLRAYIKIGGERLWAIGLPLSDRQRLYMDRSVMRRLEQGGFVRWIGDGREPYFELTDSGSSLIAR